MLFATLFGYIVSLLFLLLFNLTTQIGMALPSQSAIIFSAIFVGLFDAPHIFHTLTRTHFDHHEKKRKPIFHWLALAIPLLIALLVIPLGQLEMFILLLGLYGGWHITRQTIGLNRFIAKGKINSAEWLIYSIYFYFLFHNEASSKEIWETFLSTPVLLATQSITKALLISTFGHFAYNLRKGIQNYQWFTLMTAAYFFWLANANVHPFLITAMATITHNIQYQVWMWNYERHTFSEKFAVKAFGLTLILGILVGLTPDSEAWIIPTQIYLGFVLWHYFIDGRIWRFRNSPELQTLPSA